MPEPHARLTLPPAVPEPAKHPFPVLGTLMPMVAAVVLWVVTSSPFALVFAALGPLVALAGVLDGRRGAKRARRTGAKEREEALAALRADIAREHEAERLRAWTETPSARTVVAGEAGPGWHGADSPVVVLGSGEMPSGLRLDGAPQGEEDRALLAEAAGLAAAPVAAPLAGGIGFVGPAALARAAARAALVQCLHAVRPDRIAVDAAGEGWAWAHRPGRGRPVGIVVLDRTASGDRSAFDDTACVLAVATETAALPPGIATIVRIPDPGTAELVRPRAHRFSPALLGAAEAEAFAARLDARAERAGVAGRAGAVPDLVAFDELPRPGLERRRDRLAATLGIGADGPVAVDLVADGPHAIVAGTTGSGKSEFLVAWIAALASAHPSERLTFLLVDFKGGAAFEPVRALPHVAGIVTDLDDAEALRALESIRAEIRARERILRTAGVAELSRLPDAVALARLVIVIDEYQALMDRFPELGAIVADIAQRGRSLGMHLVLAAQRPLGVVRDAISANCPIRVSLRVLDRGDSIAVIGDPRAAEIEAGTPGRGYLSSGAAGVRQAQFALVDEASIAAIAAADPAGAPVRRPWLDPLPGELRRGELGRLATEPAGGGVAFGLADEPDRQARTIAEWHPHTDGPMLVCGRGGSGRSTALAAIAAGFEASGGGAVHRVAGAGSRVWDLLAAARGGRLTGLLVIDDLDRLGHDWDPEARQAAIDTIAGVLRTARSSGLTVAASASRLGGPAHGLVEGFGASLLLAHAGRAELSQAGGDPALWRPDAVPGSGQWRGRAVQLVHEPVAAPPAGPAVPPFAVQAGRLHLIAAASPRAALEHWQRAFPGQPARLIGAMPAPTGAGVSEPGRPAALIGDADAWNANWSLLAAERDEAVVLVDGGPAELRALVRERSLPPLLDPGRGQLWRAMPGAPLERVRWPA
ncbi:FtsK/SpoIIIE domain-containing protein [Agromyces archimandritae]|uniref:FtsK domain-containing protein n=1 Tax=Agromyces archimandritae TaxID=2781962 RepID=A0A975IP16_9MICO|nr:FtsK/SpoIIIE domain-containing protein [Agromyces archimandritae]QTX05135.1 hypothetical protein G127AT_02565 [Agromyces archimandritae]